MGADFNREKPIYAQIVEKLESRICSGYYRPGEKIPSVRELAVGNVRKSQYHAAGHGPAGEGRDPVFQTHGRAVYYRGRSAFSPAEKGHDPGRGRKFYKPFKRNGNYQRGNASGAYGGGKGDGKVTPHCRMQKFDKNIRGTESRFE